MIVLENQSIIIYFITLAGFYSASLLSIKNDFKNTNIHIQDKDIYKVYTKAIPLVGFNLFISIPMILSVLQNFYFLLNPFTFRHILHIPISFLLVDFTFYTFHYLFHTKRKINLYKFHRIHHEIRTPVSITSLYLHPIDLLLGNILPLFLPILILRSSFIILCLWVFITITETTYRAHSGLKNWSEDHDNHHKYFIYNYGSGLYLCDRVMQTYFKD